MAPSRMLVLLSPCLPALQSNSIMFACSTHHRFPLYRRLQLNFLPLPPSQNIQLNFLRNLFIVNLVGGSAAWTGDEIELLAKGQPDRIPSHPRPQHTSPSDATTLSRWWFADRWWWWGEQCLIVLSGAGESLHPTTYIDTHPFSEWESSKSWTHVRGSWICVRLKRGFSVVN